MGCSGESSKDGSDAPCNAKESGGEHAALQTRRAVRRRPSVAKAFGVRWLQHRFREQGQRGDTKSPRRGEKPVRADIFVVRPHKTNPAPVRGDIKTRTRICRSDGAWGFFVDGCSAKMSRR